MSKLTGAIRRSRYYLSFLNGDLLKIYLGASANKVGSNREHVDAAIQWLCRAQDASPRDAGVSRSHSLVFHPYFDKKGWVGSYPETTGYIIPTMFDYARISGENEFHERAIRMADWECEVQLESGAVQGGTIDQQPTPAIFNTGQVIFGWLRAYEETGKQKYLTAATKAGKFLVDVQSEDGSWRKNLSDYAGGDTMEYYTYNTRAAWALLSLAVINDPVGSFYSAGSRNIEFALGRQLDNGWFTSNCLNRPAEPLVHTIAYCIRGILEAGLLLNNDLYIKRAKKGADALAAVQRTDGSLAGRYDQNWQPTVDWSCLTGNAQISIIWSKIYLLTRDDKYLNCAKKINTYLKKVQIRNVSNPDLYGGICGSHPIHGMYGQYEILNWAAKFFIDALLLEDMATKTIPSTIYSGPHS